MSSDPILQIEGLEENGYVEFGAAEEAAAPTG